MNEGMEQLYDLANTLAKNELSRPEAMRKLVPLAHELGLRTEDAAEAWMEAEKTDGQAEPGTAESLVTERMSEVKPAPVRWLWLNRIALGKYVMLAGDPDVGKTSLWCDLAAHITTGADWPDRSKCERGSVLFATSEDGIADTISPRLIAAGADMRRVHHIKGVRRTQEDGGERDGRLSFASVEAIRDKARHLTDLRLLVWDPQDAYLGKIEASKNAKVRAGIEPLVKLAEARRFTLLGLSHPNKSLTQIAHHRMMDSIGWVAAARQVHIVAFDPDDPAENKSDRRRVFVPLKNNLARDVGGLAFRLGVKRLRELNGGSAAFIEWEEGKVCTTAAQVLSPPTTTRDTKKDDAIEFLRDLLKDGETTAKRALREAAKIGLSKTAIHRARKALGVRTRKDGQGGWRWCLEGLKSSESLKPSRLKFKPPNKSNNSKDSKKPTFRHRLRHRLRLAKRD